MKSGMAIDVNGPRSFMTGDGQGDGLELTILMPCLDEAATVGRYSTASA
jgi:hypothetical protein